MTAHVPLSRYKTDPQIKAMTDLVDAYQRREVHSAEKILRGMHIGFSYQSSSDAILRQPLDDNG